MWSDCCNILINLDNVNYIKFGTNETTGDFTATLFFDNGESLLFESEDGTDLQNYFKDKIKYGTKSSPKSSSE